MNVEIKFTIQTTVFFVQRMASLYLTRGNYNTVLEAIEHGRFRYLRTIVVGKNYALYILFLPNSSSDADCSNYIEISAYNNRMH